MDVSALTGGWAAAAAARPMGVTAQLAEARGMLRAAVPAEKWDAVYSEVRRLQSERGVPLLAALHAVHAKVTSGWLPSS